MKFSLHCTCGASMTGSATPDAKAQKLIAVAWTPFHTGEGHAPCDAKKASAVRRKEEAATAGEVSDGK